MKTVQTDTGFCLLQITSKTKTSCKIEACLSSQKALSLCFWMRIFLRFSDSGIDPLVGTVGSITWGRRLVDGTAVKFIDPREMPKAVELQFCFHTL